MPYCYACRNSKPATHRHFTDYGALALYPPKRHITEIEAEWAQLSEETRRQELQEARELLAQEAGDPASQEGAAASVSHRAPAPRVTSSRSPRRRTSTASATRVGERSGASGWIVAGLGVAALGAGAFLMWLNPGLALRIIAALGEYGGDMGGDMGA